MNAGERLATLLDQAVGLVASLLTAAIVLILAAQIFFRYVLNASLLWSEEVSTWCMVWVVFIGSAVLMRRSQHVQVAMFVRWTPMSVRPYLVIFARLASLACVTLIAVYGIEVVAGTFHIVSQTTGISTKWIKLAVPIGMGLMALFAANNLIVDVWRLIHGNIDEFKKYGVIDLGEVRSVDAEAHLSSPERTE